MLSITTTNKDYGSSMGCFRSYPEALGPEWKQQRSSVAGTPAFGLHIVSCLPLLGK